MTVNLPFIERAETSRSTPSTMDVLAGDDG